MKRKLKIFLAITLAVSMMVVMASPIQTHAMRIQHNLLAVNTSRSVSTNKNIVQQKESLSSMFNKKNNAGTLTSEETLIRMQELRASVQNSERLSSDEQAERLTDAQEIMLNATPTRVSNNAMLNAAPIGTSNNAMLNAARTMLQDNSANTNTVRLLPAMKEDNNLTLYTDCYAVRIGEYLLINSLGMDGIAMMLNGEELNLEYGEVILVKGKDTLRQLVLPDNSRVFDLSDELDVQVFEAWMEQVDEVDEQSLEELVCLLQMMDVEILESVLDGEGYAPDDKKAAALLEGYVRKGVCTNEQAWETFSEMLEEYERTRQEALRVPVKLESESDSEKEDSEDSKSGSGPVPGSSDSPESGSAPGPSDHVEGLEAQAGTAGAVPGSVPSVNP